MEFVGFYGGLVMGILGWFFGRQAARKKEVLMRCTHMFGERLVQLHGTLLS